MHHAIKQLAVLAALAGAGPLAARGSPAAPDGPGDEPLKLSLFEVRASGSDLGRYSSREAISAGRVRLDLMDSSQSVSVITSEMLQDVAGGRIADTARYVAGISDSTLPTSWERFNVRGFLAEGRTVDGITYGVFPSNGYQNIDPAIIERIEIVKGPNSILAPQPTSPGGTLNLATKKPQFRDFGTVSAQWGQFDANAAFIDLNRVTGDRFAFRIVGAGRDYDHWWKGAYVHSATVMPALTFRPSARVQATFQYTFTDWRAQNYLGLPIDPASGTHTPGRLLTGLPRDLNVYNDDAVRATRQHEFKLLVAAELSDRWQMRLVAACTRSSHYLLQINTGASTTGPGGSVDPRTGDWSPGVLYAKTPPFAPAPIAAPPTRIYTRSGLEQLSDPRQLNLQNDYVYRFENHSFKSTTLAGLVYAELRSDGSEGYNPILSVPTFDIDHPAATPWRRGSVNYLRDIRNRFSQFYVSEILALFANRLILNAAESWQDYDQRVRNLVTDASVASSPSTALPSYGVVIKPRGDTISLYYADTSQSSANAASGSGAIPPLSTSRQKEFGARFKIWDNKLYFTVSHYAIAQDNFSTPNPFNLTTPPPPTLLPNLYLDRKARGWEYELRANPSKHLSLLASYTRFKNRDPNNAEFRGVAERAGGVLASYSFDRDNLPAFAGLRVAVGVDYLGNRPGDTPLDAITPASTPANVIPTQPSFYLGSRTLVNLTLAYDSKHHWGVQVNVDNVMDKEYLIGANTRFAVFPSPPRNVRVSLRYGF